MTSSTLRPNTLAFIALCNEYCVAVQDARNMSSEDCSQFIDSMLRLLPRIYICASDLASGMADDGMEADDVYIESVLDEDYYDTVRRNV